MRTTDNPTGALQPSSVQRMAAVVEVAPGAIVSRTLMRTDGGNVTAFAFDTGQALAEHSAPFDALVHLLDGALVVSIAGEEHTLGAGEAILMPADVPHAVRAPSPAKWLLVMLKSLKGP
ncbi:MAG: cupin domain-containing protein [Thermoanaerobaculales bacterium]|nr:cupin domain-containing protein [Thermoanaerobaculales bacterium]